MSNKVTAHLADSLYMGCTPVVFQWDNYWIIPLSVFLFSTLWTALKPVCVQSVPCSCLDAELFNVKDWNPCQQRILFYRIPNKFWSPNKLVWIHVHGKIKQRERAGYLPTVVKDENLKLLKFHIRYTHGCCLLGLALHILLFLYFKQWKPFSVMMT